MLKIENLYAGYDPKNPILKGLSLQIAAGDTVGILGRNGSGKSTLAKALIGQVPYIKGEILLEGKQIVGLPSYKIAQMGVGFFFQGGRVFSNLTVHENLVFAGQGLSKKEFVKRNEELSGLFELLQKNERTKLKASYLSGGEKHQLAMAMVLVQKPKFLILDEPSAGLSPANQGAIYKTLERVRQERKTTIMVIEQNVIFAKTFAVNVYLLNEGKFR